MVACFLSQLCIMNKKRKVLFESKVKRIFSWSNQHFVHPLTAFLKEPVTRKLCKKSILVYEKDT